MRKYLSLLLVLILLLPCLALGEAGAGLSVSALEDVLRPGKAVLITFTVPDAGAVNLRLLDDSGAEVSVAVLNLAAQQGENSVWWNGTYGGVPAPEGSYRLVLEQNGQTAETPVTVGAVAPYLTGIEANSTLVTPEQPLTVSFYASCGGRLTTGLRTGDNWRQLSSWDVEAGKNTLTWEDVSAFDGDVVFTIMLTDSEGYASNEEQLAVTLSGFVASNETLVMDLAEMEPTAVPANAQELEQAGMVLTEAAPTAAPDLSDQSVFTPSYGSPYTGLDTSTNYWTLPMDITDVDAVWEMLIQPVTVLDDGGKSSGQHKRQIIIRSEPDSDSKGVGVVTNLTQSVHVLERGEEWTLIECYSSSFHDSAVKAWNMLVQGYVPTRYLKTVTPNQHMGIVVDKLAQRLYIFRDGELYDTLLCSTGLANASQPFNETRSGEFLLQNPAVGGWQDGNMYCAMGIRFNSGDILHQVPARVNGDGTKNYTSYAAALGTKASHGCIRVQRKRTPKGTNMEWIWNNRADEMKLVIWEDWQGRQLPYPDDDLTLYYNPNGGEKYHTAETCYDAVGKTFTPFTYGELETGDFAKLTRCTYCTPPLRKAEIDAINEVYAPGGDHDPILTEARKEQMED